MLGEPHFEPFEPSEPTPDNSEQLRAILSDSEVLQTNSDKD